MTDEQIAGLAERIMQHLQPPVLVMVTAATGYRDAIRRRLAAGGHRLHLALAEASDDARQWQELGEIVPAHRWQDALQLAPYRALLLPFLDYAQAADLVNGTLHSPLNRCVHNALLSGLPVLALRYHCDPASELSQLLGAKAGTAYAGHMQATLARLADCGVTLCTMNEMLERLDGNHPVAAQPASTVRRYLTVADVMNHPQLALAPTAQLTDAASDFLKKTNKNLTSNIKPGV